MAVSLELREEIEAHVFPFNVFIFQENDNVNNFLIACI